MQSVMMDSCIGLRTHHQSLWVSKTELMGTYRESPVAQGTSLASLCKYCGHPCEV